MAIQNATYKVDKKSSQTNLAHGKLNEAESTQFLPIGQDFIKEVLRFLKKGG